MKNVAEKQKQKINKDTRGKQTNKQTNKKENRGPCEGRTHDLGVISTTLCRLS